MKKGILLICTLLITGLFATTATADEVRQAGYHCHPDSTSFYYWDVYLSRMTNNSSSTKYLSCPVIGVNIQNYLYGTVYVIDHSPSPVYCSLGLTSTTGYTPGGGGVYYGTRSSSGDSSTVQTLSFSNGITALGLTPAMDCQVPGKDSSGNQSGIATYSTYSSQY